MKYSFPNLYYKRKRVVGEYFKKNLQKNFHFQFFVNIFQIFEIFVEYILFTNATNILKV